MASKENREEAIWSLNEILDYIEKAFPRNVLVINHKEDKTLPFKKAENTNKFNRATVTQALNVTVKRLKEKGLLPCKADAVVGKLYRCNKFLTAALTTPIRKYNDDEHDDPDGELSVTDEEWKLAVLLTITERPDRQQALTSQTSYTPLILQQPDRLYANAMIVHSFIFFGNVIEGIREAVRSVPISRDDWQKVVDEREDKICELHKQIDTLQIEKERLQSELERTAAAKQSDWKEYQTNLLNTERKAKEKEGHLLDYIEELEERIEMYKIIENENDEEEQEAQTPEFEEMLENIELPKKRVLLLGGHVRTMNKLKELYPEWTYVNPDTQRTGIEKTEYDIIFCLSEYISHSQFKQVMKRLDGIPIYYSGSSNVDQIIKAFKKGYFDYLSKQAKIEIVTMQQTN